jgi:hypothetical protein
MEGATLEAAPICPKQSEMTANLLHVVATRMFCKLRAWHDDAYISRRLDIFEAFTLPSLQHQTNQDFHWILLVNPDLAGPARERLQCMVGGSRNIHIVYVDIRKELHNQKEYERGFDEFLKGMPGKYDYLLSSRIDSDDCWNVNYVELLQEKVSDLLSTVTVPGDFRGALLTFPRGVICYPYEIRGKFGLVNCRKSYWSTSVDMLTSFEGRQPLYRFPHSKARKFAKNLGLFTVKIASKEPMWLYLQHDLNFALTDTDRWFRWFRIIERLFFRPYPFTDSRLGLFALSAKTIGELGLPRKARPLSEGTDQGESAVGRLL